MIHSARDRFCRRCFCCASAAAATTVAPASATAESAAVAAAAAAMAVAVARASKHAAAAAALHTPPHAKARRREPCGCACICVRQCVRVHVRLVRAACVCVNACTLARALVPVLLVCLRTLCCRRRSICGLGAPAGSSRSKHRLQAPASRSQLLATIARLPRS